MPDDNYISSDQDVNYDFNILMAIPDRRVRLKEKGFRYYLDEVEGNSRDKKSINLLNDIYISLEKTIKISNVENNKKIYRVERFNKLLRITLATSCESIHQCIRDIEGGNSSKNFIVIDYNDSCFNKYFFENISQNLGLKILALSGGKKYTGKKQENVIIPDQHYSQLTYDSILKVVRDVIWPSVTHFPVDLDIKDRPYDLFISHASEDKEGIARPINEACKKLCISAFFDEDEIDWGDSIPNKISAAMGSAPFVLVIISESFLKKDWTRKELDSALHAEVSGQGQKVLPLVVGDLDLTSEGLVRDKRYITWDGDADKIARLIKEAITS